jgi:hypothetical protein
MSSAILLVLLLQFAPMDQRPERPQVPPARGAAQLMPSEDWEQAEKRDAADRARLFADRFNHLVDTIKDFAVKYNQGAIDLKRLKAMRKAWRDLEQSDPWVGPDKAE